MLGTEIFIIFLFICIILLCPIFSYLLSTVLSQDKDYIKPVTRNRLMLIITQFCVNICIYFLDYGTVYKFIYILLSVPLLEIVYTDLMKKQIYVLANYVLGTICFINVFIYMINIDTHRLITLLLSLLFYSLTVLIEYRLKLFGKGDARTLIYLQLILLTLTSDKIVLIYEPLLWHIMIAIIVFIIRNIKLIEWKKLRLKESKPFAPDIVFAFYIVLIMCGI